MINGNKHTLLPLYIYCNTDTDCLFAKVYIEVGRGIISCASISKKLLLFSVFFGTIFL